MNFAMQWLAGALVTLALLIGSHDALAAEPPTANETAVTDPTTWGVYAQLPGTEWNDGNARWQWGPDNTIVESRTFQMKSVIRPGANRGELVSVYGGGLHTFDGRIAADGSVLWVRRGRFLKMPSRVSIVDGELIEEMVKLDDAGQVAKVGSVRRFEQTAGPKVAAIAVVPMVAANGERVAKPAAKQGGVGEVAPVPVPVPAAVAVEVATPALAPVAAAASAPVPVRPTFGALEAFIGRTLVGNTGTIEIYTEDSGNSLAIHYGVAQTNAGGGPTRGPSRHLLRKTDQPGVLAVIEERGTMYGARNFRAEIRMDGSIAVMNNVKGSRSVFVDVFRVDGDGVMIDTGWIGKGAFELSESKKYEPVTQARLAAADANLTYQIGETARQNAEDRAAEIESEQARAYAYQKFLGDLSDHAAREAQTRADADAMLAQINAQAEAQRQAQAEAQRREQQQAAADTTRRMAEQQAAPPVQQQVNAQVQPPQPPSTSGANSSATTAPGAPLRFILHIPLKTVINGVNATCYSNIVTIPGPPGWPDTWNQPGGDNEARALIKAYMPAFESQCSAYGPLTGGGPNFHWNKKGSEHISPESVSAAGQRHGQPVVQL